MTALLVTDYQAALSLILDKLCQYDIGLNYEEIELSTL